MGTYRLETTVTKDGKIILPQKFAKMFTHRVELIIKDKTEKKSEKKLDPPSRHKKKEREWRDAEPHLPLFFVFLCATLWLKLGD